jgi:hypothetical protein
MKNMLCLPGYILAAMLLPGCQTPLPPDVERGPAGTVAYEVLIEASPPGARIEANGEVIGEAPLRLKIFGDRDGTFHDFGSPHYVVRALPLTTNQYVQTRVFGTGRFFGPEDRIPERIYFDMNQNIQYVPAHPVYIYPEPSMYYGHSFYYGPRYYYRPGLRVRVPPPLHHHRPRR